MASSALLQKDMLHHAEKVRASQKRRLDDLVVDIHTSAKRMATDNDPVSVVRALETALGEWMTEEKKDYITDTFLAVETLCSDGFIVSPSETSVGNEWLDEWFKTHATCVSKENYSAPVTICYKMGGHKCTDIVKRKVDLDLAVCDLLKKFERHHEKEWNNENFTTKILNQWAQTISIDTSQTNYDDIYEEFSRPHGKNTRDFNWWVIRLQNN